MSGESCEYGGSKGECGMGVAKIAICVRLEARSLLVTVRVLRVEEILCLDF